MRRRPSSASFDNTEADAPDNDGFAESVDADGPVNAFPASPADDDDWDGPQAESDASRQLALPRQLSREIADAIRACGRSSDTVAMQQRLIDSFSDEVSDLRARLARRDGAVFRRTMLALFLAIVGAAALLLRSARHETALVEARDAFDARLRAMEAQHREALSGQLAEQQRTFEQRQERRDQQARAESAREMARVAELNETALSRTLAEKKEAAERLEEQLVTLREAEGRLAEARAEARALRARVGELEKQGRERGQVLVEWQRRALEAEARLAALAAPDDN